MSRTQILLWIAALLVLELNHLKWIWWEHWDCRTCQRKHRECSCETTKWVMYL